MHLTAIVLSIVLALLMLMSGLLKHRPTARILALADTVHLSTGQLKALGTLQIAATAGLLAGLWFTPFAIAAATGLVLYFIGAVVAHVRVGDREMQGAIAFLALSAATLALLAVTAG
ncbi:DoxX family protein [Kitasatospora sp. NPDC088346]|uniref:DoxX family protein n=1 Tax=Kitasatospora sp. NPDC088346 TaxID=3364073 RepID=UPI003821C1D3